MTAGTPRDTPPEAVPLPQQPVRAARRDAQTCRSNIEESSEQPGVLFFNVSV
jgi:hypothetical protein